MDESIPISENYFLWLSDIHFDPYYSSSRAFAPSYNKDNANCDTEDAPILGRYGCDSPISLVRAALEHAVNLTSARTPSSPAFVIVSGDSVRHGVDQLFAHGDFKEGGEARQKKEHNASSAAGSSGIINTAVEEAANSPYHVRAMEAAGDILQELASMLNSAFPESEIIVCLGNNDVVPDYYLQLFDDEDDEEDTPLGSSLSTALTPESSGMLGVLFNALSRRRDDAATDNSTTILTERAEEDEPSSANQKTILNADDRSIYLRGGYHSRTLHEGTLTILSLNTVLYSSYYEPAPSPNNKDPGKQLAWMRKVLSHCRDNGTQAIIVGHIPPAIGNFRHTQLWRDGYIQSYYDIVKEFDNVIIAQLFGHLHSDEFRIGLVDEGTNPTANFTMIPSMNTPILFGPSITPLHGNDPSLRLVKYDKGGAGSGPNGGKYRLLDYESHRLSIGASDKHWSRLYTFSEAYPMLKEDGLSSEVFRTIVESMEDNRGKESPALQLYRSLMLSGADGNDHSAGEGVNVNCDSSCRDEYLCTLQSATSAGYDNCLLERKQSWIDNGKSIFGLVVASLFVIVAVAFFIIRWRKKNKRDDYESTPSVTGIGHSDELDAKDQEII